MDSDFTQLIADCWQEPKLSIPPQTTSQTPDQRLPCPAGLLPRCSGRAASKTPASAAPRLGRQSTALASSAAMGWICAKASSRPLAIPWIWLLKETASSPSRLPTAPGTPATEASHAPLRARYKLSRGEPVLDAQSNPITLPTGTVSVSADGSVAVSTAEGSTIVGQVGVFTFANPTALSAEGTNRFVAADGQTPDCRYRNDSRRRARRRERRRRPRHDEHDSRPASGRDDAEGAQRLPQRLATRQPRKS